MQKLPYLLCLSFLCLGVACTTSKKKENSKIVITEKEPTRNDKLKITQVKNLVFRGGGVLGVVYAGALSVLEKADCNVLR